MAVSGDIGDNMFFSVFLLYMVLVSLSLDFTCCQDVTRPCLANLATPNKSSLFVYDKEKDTMVPQSCDTGECCEVLPWPEGMMYGFPYRRRNKYDYDVTVSFSSHV